jgi:hypothetical protein
LQSAVRITDSDRIGNPDRSVGGASEAQRIVFCFSRQYYELMRKAQKKRSREKIKKLSIYNFSLQASINTADCD